MSDKPYTQYKAVAERIVNKWPNIGMECDEEVLVKDIENELHDHFHLGSAKRAYCKTCTDVLENLASTKHATAKGE